MKKVKNETDATFLDVYGVSASKFRHFSNLGMYFKVIQLFKAKMEAFRERNPQKVKNDQNFLHLAFVFATQMKTVFWPPQHRNLAQTNGFTNILLDGNLGPQAGISHVHF